MKLKYMLLIVAGVLLNACASVGHEQVNLIETSALLSVQSQTDMHTAKEVQKNEFLIKLLITPVHLVRATEGGRIDVGAGQFQIQQGDRFFPVNSVQFGTLYCGYTNLHNNPLKTILHQGCLGDLNENGGFETFLTRTGASHKDVHGFIYYDAEVAQLAVSGKQTEISYSDDVPSEQDAFQIAFRLKNIAKRKGVKYAIVDILTKRPDEDTWNTFHHREPIEIRISQDTGVTTFKTPMFILEVSDVTNRSLTSVTKSVESQSTFGFKRATKNQNKVGGKPAYHISGYGGGGR